jgi:hypothetical protein
MNPPDHPGFDPAAVKKALEEWLVNNIKTSAAQRLRELLPKEQTHTTLEFIHTDFTKKLDLVSQCRYENAY